MRIERLLISSPLTGERHADTIAAGNQLARRGMLTARQTAAHGFQLQAQVDALAQDGAEGHAFKVGHTRPDDDAVRGEARTMRKRDVSSALSSAPLRLATAPRPVSSRNRWSTRRFYHGLANRCSACCSSDAT